VNLPLTQLKIAPNATPVTYSSPSREETYPFSSATSREPLTTFICEHNTKQVKTKGFLQFSWTSKVILVLTGKTRITFDVKEKDGYPVKTRIIYYYIYYYI
jgi:hypothetical protein